MNELSPIFDKLLEQVFNAGVNHGRELFAGNEITYKNFENYLKREL